ncbi:primosomal protein N' [Bacillus chungangensis]|uniref:Replication restart protein PriA n=1 Tax=Bacillus chungangensis TaxID=587633 RepID=A0ABT9WT14_9BACI|nr:primosomal protein N' [Bacillus chungangensis]MDQ0175875.1 primosomal protein N' (replication factor Y) [Bacillus chungangensis]
MRIASVIVDVQTIQTNRTYDYVIPDKWLSHIQPGMRVIVPFGPRKIQGFVIQIKQDSEVKKLKEIVKPLDLVPVLNDELLSLGEWLTEKTLCFHMSAFQAMLPTAMKAKYDKKLRIVQDREDQYFYHLFGKREEIMWEHAEEKGLLPQLQKAVKSEHIEVIYLVKNRANKKMVQMIRTERSKSELGTAIEKLPSNAYRQKKVLEQFLLDSELRISRKALMEKTSASQAAIESLIKKKLLVIEKEEIYRDPYEDRHFKTTKALPLTEEQQSVIKPIIEKITDHVHETFLLYGVTGSGKTEIYLQSIEQVLAMNKEAIVLVPEISLTPQMVQRFKERFGKLVAVLHSGLSIGEKYDEWRKIQRKEAKVVVGARSAIFAPFENLGIIIIDEEHETSYKQEENPRYHARDIAIYRGKNHRCPVVLGSATPSLESFARAKKQVYQLLTLKKRMNNQDLPSVAIVDMREEMRAGNRSMFSRELAKQLELRLERKEQTVLFLNRRGHSSFIMCRDCGYVLQCPHCDISLTYHRYNNQMKCHYCGYETVVPSQCPECESKHIRYFGTGTQKVEEEIAKLFPTAKTIRMDVDTTGKKGAHETLLRRFQEEKADILLGTQMIAKGLDFPNITLVGVLSADTMLHLPDFRASEKTFQLLTQVSGRAGRHDLKGEVVIQTYTPEHYSIKLAGEQDFERFYEQEMLMRKIGAYPPFYFIALLTITHENLMKAVSITEKITAYMRRQLSKQAIILGPSASPIPRINNRYRYQCLIKYKKEEKLIPALQKVRNHYQKQSTTEGVTISIDVNPYMMM